MLECAQCQIGQVERDSTLELAIIILNWNAAADTVRCVRQAAAWQRLQPVIWVVDNGSDDDSAAVIARQCPEARLLCNAANQGFAGGNNRGIVEALSAGDTPILLLNNDALIEEEDEDSVELTEEESGLLFIVLKTVIDALDEALDS